MSFAVILAAAVATGDLAPRDTAHVRAKGSYSIGLFDPLRIGVTDGVEVVTHPVLDVLLSPNVVARVALRERGSLRVTGEYGFSVPTFGMRLLQGYFFPKWETSDARVGWFFVPSVGVAVSGGTTGVVTARLETAVGVPLGRNDAMPLDTYAPIELAFAPALTGMRSHLQLSYDHGVTSWLRLRGGFDGWLTGPYDPPKSRVVLAAWAGADVRLASWLRVGAGVVIYDYDQRRREVVRGDDGKFRRVDVRSRDVFPMFDVIVER